jgi:hypothetical protein
MSGGELMGYSGGSALPDGASLVAQNQALTSAVRNAAKACPARDLLLRK